MVSIIENWAQLDGTVRELRPDPARPGGLVAVVDVDAVAPVVDAQGHPFPNLFADTVGQTVELQIDPGSAAEGALMPGSRISARVKRTGPGRSFAPAEHLSAG